LYLKKNSSEQTCGRILGGFDIKREDKRPNFKKDVFHPLRPMVKNLGICDLLTGILKKYVDLRFAD
jgi:hypothetical protein